MDNLERFNRRSLIKRSTVSAETPTIPSASVVVNVNDHTAGGWISTDIYVGEMFINTADDLAWIRYDSGIVQLDTASGYGAFTDLSDTSGTYVSQAGKMLQVNTSETGIEFVTNSNITTITGLSDTPISITNNKVLVGDTGVYVEKNYIDRFNSLTDVSAFLSNALKLYRVNSTESALEAIDGSSLFMDLLNIQTIAGNKTFTGTSIFNNSVTFGTEFILGSVSITDLITDITLTGALDTNIPTTLAVKTYIDDIVITAVGGSYVDLSTAQTISGIKTFSDVPIFSNGIQTNSDIEISVGNLIQPQASYHYFGDSVTDGSYRFFINPDGNLEIQKRELGVWNYKANF